MGDAGGADSRAVDDFLGGLDHPFLASIVSLRAGIMDAHPSVGEHIKWNAPSFVVAGDDRVTFQLRRRDVLQVILHRGARVRGDVATFRFADASGLVSWVTPDRGVVTFASAAEVAASRAAFLRLVAEWLRV